MRTPPAVAAALSGVGHLLVGALVWLAPEPPRPPHAQRSLEVKLVEVAPPPPRELAPPPKAVPPPRRLNRPQKAPPRPVAAPAPIAEPVVAPPTIEAPQAPPPPAPPPAPTPAVSTPTPPQQIRLFDPTALQSSVGRVVPVGEGNTRKSEFARLPGEAAGVDAKTEQERVAARVRGASVDQNARARVQAGIADPIYTKLGRAMLAAWDPDKALPETSAALWARNRAKNAAVGMQMWAQSARNFAATGSPLAAGETIEQGAAETVRDQAGTTVNLDQMKSRETYRNYMRGKFNEAKSALVLVEEFGTRVKVSLTQSSGDMEIDRAALDDIRRAAEIFTAESPPSSPRRSLWSVRLQIIITPPIPVGGFTFDEVLEKPKLELPLGRKLLKRIQLEAVYDDDPRTAKAPGASLAVE